MEINVCEVVAGRALHDPVIYLPLPAEKELGCFQVHSRIIRPKPLEKRLKPMLLGDGETCAIINLSCAERPQIL